MRPKMPGVLLALAFVSTGLVGQTTEEQAASFSAEVLREACENLVLAVRGLTPISQEDPGAMLCLGFIAGWSQAMEATDQQPFCLPDAARDRPGDIADLIVSWIDGHPEARTFPAHHAVVASLVDAFPCEPEADASETDDGSSPDP